MAHWNSSRYDHVTAEIIGRGESAIVYKARDKLMSRTVAIKQQPKQPASARIDTARAELNSLKALRGHQHIIRMFDYWEDAVNTYMVLEYAPGGELLDFVMRYGPLCERTLQLVFRQIVSAIQFAHDPARRVIHRDLKLDNIFLLNPLGEPLSAIVGDWGFSCRYDPFGTITKNCGSVHYASPEIILNLAYIGPEVDVWSLGVILWALATGEFPCDGDSPAQICRAIRKAGDADGKFSLAKKIDRRVDLSPQLRDLIKRILQFDPNNRPTPLEILQHPFLHSTEPTSPPPLLPAPAMLLPPPIPLRILGATAGAGADADASSAAATAAAAAAGDASASESALARSASFSMTARATTDNPGAKRSHSTSAFPRHTTENIVLPADYTPAAASPGAAVCEHSPRRMKPTRLRTPLVASLDIRNVDYPPSVNCPVAASSSSSKTKKTAKSPKPRRSKSPKPKESPTKSNGSSLSWSSSSSNNKRQSSTELSEGRARKKDVSVIGQLASRLPSQRSASPGFRIIAKRVASSPQDLSIDADAPARLNTSDDSQPLSLADASVASQRSASRPPPSSASAAPSSSSSSRRREKRSWPFNLSLLRSRRNRSRSLQDTV